MGVLSCGLEDMVCGWDDGWASGPFGRDGLLIIRWMGGIGYGWVDNLDFALSV